MILLNVVAEEDQQRFNDLIAKVDVQDTKLLSKYAMPEPLLKMSTVKGVLKQIEDARGNTALVCTLTMEGDMPKVEEHTFNINLTVV